MPLLAELGGPALEMHRDSVRRCGIKQMLGGETLFGLQFEHLESCRMLDDPAVVAGVPHHARIRGCHTLGFAVSRHPAQMPGGGDVAHVGLVEAEAIIIIGRRVAQLRRVGSRLLVFVYRRHGYYPPRGCASGIKVDDHLGVDAIRIDRDAPAQETEDRI